ncbi:MAG: DsbA family protein, partial [Myxococcota bacterium]
GREQLDSLEVLFHERGIYGVPTYVLGDEVIFGREHIPYLRWALSGQQGPAPDMAYELEPPRGAPQGETSEALTLYIDFKSPAAYLALQPTLDLIRRTRVPVRWRPFVTYERELPASASDPGRSQRHRDVRAASRQAILTKYAAEQGIELRFREPGVEAALALSVLTLAAEDPLPFIEAAFRAYWHDGLDLDDEATVQALLRRSGLSAPPWTAEEGRAALAWAQGEAEASGIVDAPAYVVGEHVFVGHAHLPWIEELLGRS